MKFAQKYIVYRGLLTWMLYSSLVLPSLLPLIALTHKMAVSLYQGLYFDRAFMGGLIIFFLLGIEIVKSTILWIIPSIFIYTTASFFFPSLASTLIKFTLTILLIYLSLVLATYQIIFENFSVKENGIAVLIFFFILVTPKLYFGLRRMG